MLCRSSEESVVRCLCRSSEESVEVFCADLLKRVLRCFVFV